MPLPFDLSELYTVLRAIFIFVVFLIGGRIASKRLPPLLGRVADHHSQIIVRRLIFYACLILGILLGLQQLGFDLGVLVGAAGVLTVAIGFAAQTSTANIISGLFLLIEKRFGEGDLIEVGATTGEVLSIGWLSTALRTLDNIAVRIPNETLMKTEIKNLTRFPLRRIDFALRSHLTADFERTREILLGLADLQPHCLDEPQPFVTIERISDAGLEFQFSVWCARQHYADLKNRMQIAILEAFATHKIEIPFPHRQLVAAPAPRESAP